MTRETLAAEALQAGMNSFHNLRLIQSNPDVMIPGKLGNAEEYLNRMIRFAEAEMKNARLAGRTLGKRTKVKSLVLLILASFRAESKGERV
ncbi:hypothetical protein ACIFOE_20140 [Paenibacillus sp. NRS-1783]|uniref:hypothetical protein n=1 Tax=Paenibacillus sp. NRS-1783 TaxID=3233907 RepID=UPI003D2D2E1E